MKVNLIQVRNPYLDKMVQPQKIKQAVAPVKQPQKMVSADLNKGTILDIRI